MKNTDEKPGQCTLVAGASGGIGSAYCNVVSHQQPNRTLIRLARNTQKLPPLAVDTLDLAFDLSKEASIIQAVTAIPASLQIDEVIIATGFLHGAGMTPEKTFQSLDAQQLLQAYLINAVGPALLLKHLQNRLSDHHIARIGILSARVGSISDNRLGGWHSYRASKAALNMLIKNFAIEFARKKPQHIIVGLQPGTTDSALSKPFQKGLPQGQLQTPEFTATHLFRVMSELRAEDSGCLLDFRGQRFEP